MAFIEVSLFDINHSDSDKIQGFLWRLEATEHSQNSVVGKQISQDSSRTTIQITSALDDTEIQADLQSDRSSTLLVRAARDLLGKPRTYAVVELSEAAFGPEGPANAKVIEYAESWFPASDVTPEFRRRIEQDFIKFNDIFIQESSGHSGLAFGWGIEEQDHADIGGQRARNFLIIRGWNSFDDFKRSVNTDAYKRATPILLQWKAPFEMVSQAPLNISGSERTFD